MSESVPAWQVQGLRFATLLGRAVPLADSLEDAIEAVDAAMAMEDTGHIPATYRPQEAALGPDIFDKKAQKVLDRAMKAVRQLSTVARRELKEILKTDHPGVLARAVVQFVDRYRNQLTQILGRTNLASLLEGARQVASKMPPIALPGLAGPPPVSLGPEAAAGLLRKLQGMPEGERERELYELPAEQQAYAREALAVGGMEPPLPPVALPVPPAGSPDELHFPIIEEAVKDLSERNVVNRFEYDRLEAAARRKAFTVANVQARETLTKIRDALAENVAEGASLETFREKVLASVDEGTFMSDSHMEVTWRTNVQTAFSDGQMAVLSHPVVREGFPYIAYDAIHDDRVRPNHLALERLGIEGGNVYRADDPVFQIFRPPWDYNDRCSWTPMTVRQAAEKGIPEAVEWLRTGNEPTPPAFVPMPPFRPPPGFDRSLAGAPLSIRLSLEPCGASFALDERGDWHGPTPPGEGWVQVGHGPQGGLVWRKQGSQAPQQPSQQQAPSQQPVKPPGHADASFQVAKQNLARVISQATDRKAIAQEMKSQAEWLRDTLSRAIDGALDEATAGIPPAAAKSVRSKALRVARDAAKDFRDDVSNMASQYKRQDFLAELPNLTLDLGTPLGDFEAEIHSELKDYAFDRGTRRLSDAELNDPKVIDRVDAEAEAWAKGAATKAKSALQSALGGGPSGAAFGMVGDEWHGPEPPGPGWVEVGQGPKGGKVWKQQGQTQQQPAQKPVQRPQQSQTQRQPSQRERAVTAVAELERQAGVKFPEPQSAQAVYELRGKEGRRGYRVSPGETGGLVFSCFDPSNTPGWRKEYNYEINQGGDTVREWKVTYDDKGAVVQTKYVKPPPEHWVPETRQA